mmetsp:Transcript_52863/g.158227  ORF Transcript_52863/g.158227 Transcript_52863/m.158227 type:complete len:273 (-) Transcript_52863:188-1006(-)|eukprot:CAMPEP_0113563042 /NCGR_PEP_ID=MMETSP0015_2-20120614/20845_1 /TAXON_ID=2838 /ORGANISM="Odontella" /LENGTH=272 /DNA_ID=CAMNT_0000464971 /DNA_START=19 /DNA_END=837 /DNA_ORIENTATION=- /assembly_acc=CAM_ASM_000160
MEEVEWIESPDGWGKNDVGEKHDSDDDSDDGGGGGGLFADTDPRDFFEFRVQRQERHLQDAADKNAIEVHTTTIRLAGFKLDSSQTDKSTGVTLWQAAPCLANYIMSLDRSSEMITGRKVLELGAGLGLCGIVAHHLGAERVVLTDADTNALQEMRRNVNANRRDDDEADDPSICCSQLRWGSPRPDHPFKQSFGAFDTILAADVIYAEESVQLLFDTVDMLLKTDGQFLLSWLTRWNSIPEDLVLGAARDRNMSWTKPEQEEGIYIIKRKV